MKHFESYHNENKEEKCKIFDILMQISKMKCVQSMEIMLNTKIPHLFWGDVWLAIHGVQKGNSHYQNHATDKSSCLKMELMLVL